MPKIPTNLKNLKKISKQVKRSRKSVKYKNQEVFKNLQKLEDFKI